MNSITYDIGKEIGELASSIQNSIEDGKVNVAEWVDMGKEGGTAIYTFVKNWGEIKECFVDGLDVTEITDLKEGFKDGYNIENEATEETVEITFDYSVMLLNAIAGIILAQKSDVDGEDEDLG